MKRSTIHFTVDLDSNNVPDRILWDATDRGDSGPTETKSISVAVWDHTDRNTLRIDLWAKDMPVTDLKRFYIDCIGGLSQSLLRATGDEKMASEMRDLCDRMAKQVAETG
jgi:gliding motility-associated protein GldC